MDCSLSGSSVHGILQARILEWVANFLLQGIFPTQGLNPGLPHCGRTLYHLSHQGKLIPRSESPKRRWVCVGQTGLSHNSSLEGIPGILYFSLRETQRVLKSWECNGKKHTNACHLTLPCFRLCF